MYTQTGRRELGRVYVERGTCISRLFGREFIHIFIVKNVRERDCIPKLQQYTFVPSINIRMTAGVFESCPEKLRLSPRNRHLIIRFHFSFMLSLLYIYYPTFISCWIESNNKRHLYVSISRSYKQLLRTKQCKFLTFLGRRHAYYPY